MGFLVYVSVLFLNMKSTLHFIYILQLGGPITPCCENELEVWKTTEGTPSSLTCDHELGEENANSLTSNRNWSYIILPAWPYYPLSSTSTFDTQAYWSVRGPIIRMVGLMCLSLLNDAISTIYTRTV
jgi:hypothetical protein